MKKTLILSFILGAMASTAFAVPTPIPSASELPEFEQFNVPISVPSYENRTIYRFNPPANGVMTVYEKANDAYLFVGRFYNQHEYSVLGGWYGTGPVETLPEGYDYGFAYPMESDQQYYISIPLESYNRTSEVLFTWEQEEATEVAVTTIIPEPTLKEPFDYNSFYDILIFADKSISSFESVTLKYQDKEIELPKGEYCGINGSISNQFLQILVAGNHMHNYIKQAIDDGATQITIVVKGLSAKGIEVTGNATNNEYVSVNNGTVTFVYALEKAPEYIPEESSWPETFYNYWTPDNPDGKAVLVFDQPISSVNKAWLSMAQIHSGNISGNVTATTYYLDPVIEYNKVILDFTGVERKADTNYVTIVVQSVFGANGLPAEMGENGTTLIKYLPYIDEEAPSDGTSGVNYLQKEKNPSYLYNLKGQKIDARSLGKGMYIQNGKKILIK